jgi:hypothetical protein
MKPIYKLVVRFPGILVPTYSKEEYDAMVERECKQVVWIFSFISICLLGGFGFLAASILHLAK